MKIVDYGLATFHNEKTIIFTKCGTPGFVAPEIITYDEKEAIYGLNVDTFSVGVIMHILLVGEQSFPGKSRNTILNKNKECKIDFKGKKYEEIAGDGIDLLSKLLEKSPERRITAKEALSHPFLIKDRPVFKFKKVYREEEMDKNDVQMKMYQNLEEIVEEESPTKIKAPPSSTAATLKAVTLSKYYEEIAHYDPYGHEISTEMEERARLAVREDKTKMVFDILEVDREKIP